MNGDVTGLTDASGTVTQKYDYDAFGNEQPLADYPTENDQNPFRYCGEYLDAETGTYYLRARYYNPITGRFTQEDPAQAGLNWYVYCSNNPINRIDPSGLADVLLRYIAEKNGATINVIQKRVPLLGVEYGLSHVDITIGEVTHSFSGTVVNGRMIVDSDEFGAIFGITDQTQLTHQPGDEFYSMDDAAIAWGLSYSQLTIDRYSLAKGGVLPAGTYLEYGSAIYESGSRYAYTSPNEGYGKAQKNGSLSIDTWMPGSPNGEAIVGYIHSHPAYYDDPSGANPNEFSSGDIGNYYSNKHHNYLVTPSGDLKYQWWKYFNKNIRKTWKGIF